MKKLFFVLLAFLAFATGNSQIKKPVKWTSKTEKISDTEFNLIMSATIEDGWHVYSQFTPDDGPLPISLTFKNQKGNFELVGKAKESPYKKHFNTDFGVDEYYFENKFTLTQKVKITNPKTSKIVANVDFQVCLTQCINDNVDFNFDIPVSAKAAAIVPTTVDTSRVETTFPVDTVKPEVKEVKKTAAISEPIKAAKKGLWTIFFLAFLGGFAALLTPCVFPMIPMTVSFFTKQSKNPAQGKRNAILFGISIIAIYVILGLAINAIFGADALNALSTNVWFNVIFFLLLVVFAVSFLGAFEIMLPNSWANKVDRQADKGGVIGILFMALALAIVSFSCTGPIVGTLLVESASKGGIAPVIGMLGFSTALALPFMLFALFPSWMQSLPKSGGWLNTVKVSLGFLELAFAFKFLSNADLVLQLHYFERETFLSIWIAIFGTWAIYLLGKITLPHDSPLAHISVGRLGLALLVLAFTFYMIPGLFGAPLKLISAFTPPQTYSESPRGFMGTSNGDQKLPDGAEFGPNGLVIFTDYEKGLAYAKEVKKPILLDFTGHACSNCRKMENNVWTDENVSKILKNDVVLISLFADDKRPLPKEEQFISKSTGSEIETIGDKWTDLMITKFKTNTQPLYVVEDLEGNNLNPNKPTTSYDPDVKLYENWLKEGVANFK
ncbi:cytochrome c biogenesis protein CcdA [Flavobacterium sp.]|uniref:protein-disulfide reductase DsbD family protein n=1 Tax=Flavobacterium sp. TaxID=239 RepID=UPI0037508988